MRRGCSFAPFEPFLIDGPADHKRTGRIARVSLEPIWEWIGRDLMPAEAKALSEDINRALARQRSGQGRTIGARAARPRDPAHAEMLLAAVGTDEKARRRLGVQVGTPRAIDDLSTMLRILAVRDVLADLARRLPSHIRAFEREQIDAVKASIDASAATKFTEARGDAKSDVVLYGLIMVMNRLAAPWQLIRIATRAAESDDAARIAETPYAVAVTIVLGEIEEHGRANCAPSSKPGGRSRRCSRPFTTRRADCAPKSILPSIRPGAGSSRRSAATFRTC